MANHSKVSANAHNPFMTWGQCNCIQLHPKIAVIKCWSRSINHALQKFNRNSPWKDSAPQEESSFPTSCCQDEMLNFGGVFDSNYRWTGACLRYFNSVSWNTWPVAIRTCQNWNGCGNIKLDVMHLVCFTCILLVPKNGMLQDFLLFGRILLWLTERRMFTLTVDTCFEG